MRSGVDKMRVLLYVIIACSVASARGQAYDASRIFAHNDYVRPRPFYTAYDLQVGYIEADVFLVDGALLVAHQRGDIARGKTLDALYLDPLAKQVARNGGSAYADGGSLTLMIDLKTEGTAALRKLVERLEAYPQLLSCSGLHFMISGNVPPPREWADYPAFITIDGRPGTAYTAEQLGRVAMISTNFRDHVKWNGKGPMTDGELKKLDALMDEVHAKGKRIRFWATPDFQTAWKEQMRLDFDVIVTDDVAGLAGFIKEQE